MYPIFFCKKCGKSFELYVDSYSVLIEKVTGYDAQSIYSDSTRQPVICPNCNGQDVDLKENGHCTLLKRPTKAKARDLQQLREEGLPLYIRKFAKNWQPEKIF
jgi:hypothetical protein